MTVFVPCQVITKVSPSGIMVLLWLSPVLGGSQQELRWVLFSVCGLEPLGTGECRAPVALGCLRTVYVMEAAE